MNESPWMTLKETAIYTRRHITTIQRACQEFEHSQGKRGLKNEQRTVPNGKRFVHVGDADRWISGQPPSHVARKTTAA